MRMRERFEALFADKAKQNIRGGYDDHETQRAWRYWQAAWTAAAQECAMGARNAADHASTSAAANALSFFARECEIIAEGE